MSRTLVGTPVLLESIQWPSTLVALPTSAAVPAGSPERPLAELIGRDLTFQPGFGFEAFLEAQKATKPTAEEVAAVMLDVSNQREFDKAMAALSARTVAAQLPGIDKHQRVVQRRQAALIAEARRELAGILDQQIAENAEAFATVVSLDLRGCVDTTPAIHAKALGVVVGLAHLAFHNPGTGFTMQSVSWDSGTDAITRYLGLVPASGSYGDPAYREVLDRVDAMGATVQIPSNGTDQWKVADHLLRMVNGVYARELGTAVAPITAASLIDPSHVKAAGRLEQIRTSHAVGTEINAKSGHNRERAAYEERAFVSPAYLRALRDAMDADYPPAFRSIG